jgi:four helix bundle protein
MNKTKKIEDLRVWQEGMLLVCTLRSAYKGNEGKHNDFIDHMQHYAFGIPAMIAEGYATNSNIEFVQSLCAAIYICTKLSAYLHSALEANIIDRNYQRIQLERIKKITQLLNGLINIRQNRRIHFKKSTSLHAMDTELHIYKEKSDA